MKIFIKIIILIFCTVVLFLPTNSMAQEKQKTFIDTMDNALDVSYYLNNLHGFLPIISPITEPTVGFGGYGKTYKSLDELPDNTYAWNGGAGFRYLIARLFGLKMGLDIARGTEQWAVYVVVGTAWLK